MSKGILISESTQHIICESIKLTILFNMNKNDEIFIGNLLCYSYFCTFSSPSYSDFNEGTNYFDFAVLRALMGSELLREVIFFQKLLSFIFFTTYTVKKPYITNLPELTRRQKVVGPLLNVADTDIKSGGDDTDFVQTTGQIDNNFAAAVIVDFLEFADISVLHHNLK